MLGDNNEFSSPAQVLLCYKSEKTWGRRTRGNGRIFGTQISKHLSVQQLAPATVTVSQSRL